MTRWDIAPSTILNFLNGFVIHLAFQQPIARIKGTICVTLRCWSFIYTHIHTSLAHKNTTANPRFIQLFTLICCYSSSCFCIAKQIKWSWREYYNGLSHSTYGLFSLTFSSLQASPTKLEAPPLITILVMPLLLICVLFRHNHGCQTYNFTQIRKVL